MFTGIVETLGEIVQTTPFTHSSYAGLSVQVACEAAFLDDVKQGDSIAIQGACMTVVAQTVTSFTVDVSQESLSKTTGLAQLGKVNLEKALSLQTRLGGHLVTGHIDGLARVKDITAVGESYRLTLTVPHSLAPYFAAKGSGCFNGVSLTTNTVFDHADGCDIEINLIPHTWANTTLSRLKVGDVVNTEIDVVARYLQRMLTFNKDT